MALPVVCVTSQPVPVTVSEVIIVTTSYGSLVGSNERAMVKVHLLWLNYRTDTSTGFHLDAVAVAYNFVESARNLVPPIWVHRPGRRGRPRGVHP